MRNEIMTLDFGRVPVRRTYTDGTWVQDVELSQGGFAEIRLDYKTEQPFAVLLDENWQPL